MNGEKPIFFDASLVSSESEGMMIGLSSLEAATLGVLTENGELSNLSLNLVHFL
jgi:hypothetical protein